MFHCILNAISLDIDRVVIVCNSKRTYIEGPYMVVRWSFAFTRKSIEDVLRRLKEVLRTSPAGRRLGDVLKNAVATSISDQSKTS